MNENDIEWDDDFDLDDDEDDDLGEGPERPVRKPIVFDRFDNTFAELRYVTSCLWMKGTWARLPDGRRTFTVDTGAQLIWCPTTKQLRFEGPTQEAASELGAAVFDSVMLAALFGNRS